MSIKKTARTLVATLIVVGLSAIVTLPASVGQPTGLNTASSSDSSEDFINPHPGDVSDYYAMGMVSAQVNRHYGSLTASQLEYAPSGVPSGLCVGVAADPFQREPLSLQPCTVPGRTVWIIGTTLSPATAGAHLFPIVSGATSDFSRPFAMSYPRHVRPMRPCRRSASVTCNFSAASASRRPISSGALSGGFCSRRARPE